LPAPELAGRQYPRQESRVKASLFQAAVASTCARNCAFFVSERQDLSVAANCSTAQARLA